MAKFTAALAFLLASAISTDARINPAAVSEAARKASKVSPILRLKEVETRRKLESKMLTAAKPVDRKLENNNGQNQNQQFNYWNNEWNADKALEEYGFCINEYSVKYVGCQNAQSFSDTVAADDTVDGVIMNEGFATFRLCPKDQCQSNSKYGCQSNYGEYVVTLSTYLAGLVASEEERVENFCNMCNECAGIQSAKTFISEVQGHRTSVLAQADSSMQAWITNYQAQLVQDGAGYYNGNGNYVAYGEDDYATTYWNVLRSNQDYASSYQGGAYNSNNVNGNGNGNGNGNYGNGYKSGNQQWWQNQQDMEQFWSASYQQANENNWNNMGTWYGRPILNGYFGDDGVFYEGWGYFSAYDGEYHFLVGEDGMEAALFYDPALFGDMPENWDEGMFEVRDEDGNEIELESCSYSDLSACSGQYEACMQIIGDEGYNQYMMNMYGEDYQGTPRLSDFLRCTGVDSSGAVVDAQEYAQDQAYAQYQANKQYQQQGYGNNCNGDEDCEAQAQYNNNMQQYYQQQQAEQMMNNQYYIGPRCAADGHSIQLAVYKDAYCSMIQEDLDAEKMLGYDPLEDSDNLFPNECISCQMERQDAAQQWYGQYGQNQEEQQQEQEENYQRSNGVSTMCSMLFQTAGKCHRNLDPSCQYNYNQYNNYYNQNCEGEECDQQGQQGQEGQQGQQGQNQQMDFDQMFQSQQQAANEEAVCNFIDTLQAGAYNENGEITLRNDAWAQGWSNPSNWKQEYNLEKQALSGGRKAALSIGALACALMAGYACYLHGALARKNIPWRPRRSKGEDPMDVVRQNSGIVMGRSRSGPANAPLI